MSGPRFSISVRIHLTDDNRAVIHFGSQSRPILAGALGVESDSDGREVVYLDRKIHRLGVNYEGWALTGAISTIATRARTANAA